MEVSKKNEFRILSIDGGGIRGVVPAHILNCMSKKLDVDLKNEFQMFVGTSTGSIIASAIACSIDMEEILNFYKEYGEKVFTKNKSWWPKCIKPMAHSLYNNAYLEKYLREIFKDKKLGDIAKPLILPSTDIGNGGVHVFKSQYSEDFSRDSEVLISDAIAASCSAPTYFNPVKVGEYALTDGGLWANNPSLIGFIDAQRRLRIPASNIKIFSIGTGHAKKFYGTNLNKNWGMLNGWGGKKFIHFILSLQSLSTCNYLQLLMPQNNFFRLDFESDRPLPLDDCNIVNDLLSKSDKLFTYNTERIKKFLNLNQEEL